MKIDILCEGRLNKNIENEICNLYINRSMSVFLSSRWTHEH